MFTSSFGRSGALAKVGKALSLLAAVLMMLTGLIHIFSELKAWCHNAQDPSGGGHNPDITCAGAWLQWQNTGLNQNVNPATKYKWTDDFNKSGYRSVFTFEPSQFVDNWTPMAFGIVALSCQFAGSKFESITKSWSRQLWWHLFAAMFGVLGFAGGWGVLAGFFIITFCAVFLALIFLDPASDDVSLDLNFGGAAPSEFEAAGDSGGEYYHSSGTEKA